MEENPYILVKSCSKMDKPYLTTNFEAFAHLLKRYYHADDREGEPNFE